MKSSSVWLLILGASVAPVLAGCVEDDPAIPKPVAVAIDHGSAPYAVIKGRASEPQSLSAQVVTQPKQPILIEIEVRCWTGSENGGSQTAKFRAEVGFRPLPLPVEDPKRCSLFGSFSGTQSGRAVVSIWAEG